MNLVTSHLTKQRSAVALRTQRRKEQNETELAKVKAEAEKEIRKLTARSREMHRLLTAEKRKSSKALFEHKKSAFTKPKQSKVDNYFEAIISQAETSE